VDVLDAVRNAVLVIIRGSSCVASIETAVEIANGGINAIEVSLTSKDALQAIHQIRSTLPDHVTVGAGTILDADDARRARDAGAEFLVTPGLPDDLHSIVSTGLRTIVGAFSPTEVRVASQGGASAVKLFPASSGGIRHLSALREPFPTTRFVPVGGVRAEQVREYLAAGAYGVGLGRGLVGDAADGGSLPALRLRVARVAAILEEEHAR